MTNPGDSDEWWKQYGGQGVSSESAGGQSGPQYPNAEQPSGYPSMPQYPAQPAAPEQPQYPNYQQPQAPNYQQPYPQQPYPGQQPYPQPPNYGYPGQYQPYGIPQRGTNGLAIAALITSVAGLVTCGVTAIVGLILGIVSLNQIKQSGQEGRGLAQAAIWVGIGVLVLIVLYFVVVIIAAAN